MQERIASQLEESASIQKKMAKDLSDIIARAAQAIMGAYGAGKKVLLAGNGGSAADAQHIAAELVGRFKLERAALPALALTTDTSILTALANDYGYETVFSRQIEALAEEGDVFVAITTSGTSRNILKAVEAAHSKGLFVVGLTGKGGGRLKKTADITIMVPSDNAPRIQEAHTTIAHIICQVVEDGLFNEKSSIVR